MRLKIVGFTIILSSICFGADLSSLAQGVIEKAGGNKTEAQWKRYFESANWQKKLGIDSLDEKTREALLNYVCERSAEKDQASIPK